MLREELLEILRRYLELYPQRSREVRKLSRLLGSGNPILPLLDLDGHVTASAILFDRSRSQVMLVYHPKLQRWLQPGGHVKSGENVWDCAIREIGEETGLGDVAKLPSDNRPVPLDINTHTIPADSTTGEPSHLHHDFLYLFDASEYLPSGRQPDCETHWFPLVQLAKGSFGDRLQRAALTLIGGQPPDN